MAGESKGTSRLENETSLSGATALAEEVVRLVEEELSLPQPSVADEALLHDVAGLKTLLEKLATLRELSLSLSRGELEYATRQTGIVIGALKGLQANLRHLTWQAQRIAAGELNVRVSFLGQFSDAFNSMTAQLKGTLEEKDRLTAHYRELSAHDPLTGVYNRGAFLETAARLLAGDVCRERGSALIMSDIDHFKAINDTFGHQCGDEVLRRISHLYQDLLRQEDILCRYGGEEFLILAPGISCDIARGIAQRLCDAVRSLRISCGNAVVSVTASFGVCSMPPLRENEPSARFLREHIQIADLRLYQAKHDGRDRVVCEDCKEERGNEDERAEAGGVLS